MGHEFATSWLTQCHMLLHRSNRAIYRNRQNVIKRIILSLAMGLVFGFVFYQGGNTSEKPYALDRNGGRVLNSQTVTSMYFVLIYALVSNAEYIPSIVALNGVYRRELAAGAYSPGPYWLSMWLTHLPMVAIRFVPLYVVAYFLIGFTFTPACALYYFVVMFATNFTTYTVVLFLAAATNRSEVALAAFPFTITLFAIFNGYFIRVYDIPVWWKWASIISFSRWSWQGLVINAYSNQGEDGEFVIKTLGFDNYNKFNTLWILLLTMSIVLLLLYYALTPTRSRIVYSSEPLVPYTEFSSDLETVEGGVAMTNFSGPSSGTYSLVSPPSPCMCEEEEEEAGGEVSGVTEEGAHRQVQTALTPTSISGVLGDDERLDEPCADLEEGARTQGEADDFSIAAVPYTVTAFSVSYSIPDSSASESGGTRELLSDVSMVASPSEVCAIFGASGGGKLGALCPVVYVSYVSSLSVSYIC
jgi:ABC-type multidrug transport system fused ATPase/permease subunit